MWKYKVSAEFYEEFAGENRVICASRVFSTKVCAEIAYVALKASKSVVAGSLKVECVFVEGEQE